MCERFSLELPSHRFLSQLARDDPDAYEDLRRKLIETFIESAPVAQRPRLRGLQFRVDGVRRLSSSPLGRTGRVFGLMWESFVHLNDELSCFRGAAPVTPAHPRESAQVIALRPPDPH